MENTAYIALSRQNTLRREMNLIANNLANMNTTAFKGDKMMFVEHLVKSKGGERILGEKLSFVRDIATWRDTSEGKLEHTGNPLDVAIRGDGWLTVETPNGPRYTRAGRLQMDATGQLVTQQGNPVLSEGGQPFIFSPEDKEILISRDGTVATENGVLGRLAVVRFENQQEMMVVAGGLFTTEQNPEPVEQPDVAQYMVEASNVEPIIEMTRMIEVNRSYQSVKSMIEKEDERLKKMFEDFTRTA